MVAIQNDKMEIEMGTQNDEIGMEQAKLGKALFKLKRQALLQAVNFLLLSSR